MLTKTEKQQLRDKIELARKLAREAIEAETQWPYHAATATKINLAKDAWKALDDWIYKEL